MNWNIKIPNEKLYACEIYWAIFFSIISASLTSNSTRAEQGKGGKEKNKKWHTGILFVIAVAAARPEGLGVIVFLSRYGDADMTATCRDSLTLRLESIVSRSRNYPAGKKPEDNSRKVKQEMGYL